ncbi:Hypp5136 [Branchiostoma lanceolatum]|uniref:Hypp5136 protein n=1 Tax=Branchiostoma lanceolatum TaxID=7740 RepID=A0A8K0EYB4_BRALA|nr:Hypp5136 [Branchiostoma lanceolatum]
MLKESNKDKQHSAVLNLVGAAISKIGPKKKRMKELIRDSANDFCKNSGNAESCCKGISYASLASGDLIPITSAAAEQYVFLLRVDGEDSNTTDNNVGIQVLVTVPKGGDNGVCVQDSSRRKRDLDLQESFFHREKRAATTPSPTVAPDLVFLDPSLVKTVLDTPGFRTSMNTDLGLLVGLVAVLEESDCEVGDDIQPWVIGLITITAFLTFLLIIAAIVMCVNGKKNKDYSRQWASKTRVTPIAQ